MVFKNYRASDVQPRSLRMSAALIFVLCLPVLDAAELQAGSPNVDERARLHALRMRIRSLNTLNAGLDGLADELTGIVRTPDALGNARKEHSVERLSPSELQPRPPHAATRLFDQLDPEMLAPAIPSKPDGFWRWVPSILQAHKSTSSRGDHDRNHAATGKADGASGTGQIGHVPGSEGKHSHSHDSEHESRESSSAATADQSQAGRDKSHRSVTSRNDGTEGSSTSRAAFNSVRSGKAVVGNTAAGAFAGNTAAGRLSDAVARANAAAGTAVRSDVGARASASAGGGGGSAGMYMGSHVSRYSPDGSAQRRGSGTSLRAHGFGRRPLASSAQHDNGAVPSVVGGIHIVVNTAPPPVTSTASKMIRVSSDANLHAKGTGIVRVHDGFMVPIGGAVFFPRRAVRALEEKDRQGADSSSSSVAKKSRQSSAYPTSATPTSTPTSQPSPVPTTYPTHNPFPRFKNVG